MTKISLDKKIWRLYGLVKSGKHIKNGKPIFLNLGSGGIKMKGYLNIDIVKNADFVWDIRRGLPFADNSISGIYSSHFFEHLNIDTFLFVLGECLRVLVKGGEFEIVVPHINPYMGAYKKKDMKFLKKKIYDVPDHYKNIYNTPFDLIMWLLYRNGEHKIFFDKDSLISKLKLVGFTKIKERKYNSRKDLNKRFSSIYLTAYKKNV